MKKVVKVTDEKDICDRCGKSALVNSGINDYKYSTLKEGVCFGCRLEEAVPTLKDVKLYKEIKK